MRGVFVGVVLAGMLAWLAPASALAAPGDTGAKTFEYTGAAQPWTVPPGVSTLGLDLFGAQGGPFEFGEVGGEGARVQAAVPVTPGTALEIRVGGRGGLPDGGFNGGGAGDGLGLNLLSGGGGGATDVRPAGGPPASRLMVAGAGGGTALALGSPFGGDSGRAGEDGSVPAGSGNSAGGGAPGTSGAAGAGGLPAISECAGGIFITAGNGSAGSGAEGGAGGSAERQGAPTVEEGGGGGGGLFGGGGGGGGTQCDGPANATAAGGGGGSSSSGAGITVTEGQRESHGQAVVGFVETEPPTVAGNVTGTLGDNGYYTSDVGITFTRTAQHDFTETPGCAGQTFTADTDGADVTCTITTNACTPGPCSTDSETVTVKRDTVVPDTVIDEQPAALTNDPTPAFRFSTSEAGGQGFQCSIDGGAFAACPASFETTTLADGAHALQVRAKDKAGNLDPSPARGAFTVDTAPPRVAFTSGPAGFTLDTSPSFAFSVSEAATTVCRLDSGPILPCTSPFRPAGVAFGRHTVAVLARDAAGNLGPAARAFEVGEPVPVVSKLALARCVRAAKGNRALTLLPKVTLSRRALMRVRIERVLGVKALRRCPKRGGKAPSRFKKVKDIDTQASATALRRTLRLKAKLKPGLYRVSFTGRTPDGRSAKTVRRFVHVLKRR